LCFFEEKKKYRVEFYFVLRFLNYYIIIIIFFEELFCATLIIIEVNIIIFWQKLVLMLILRLHCLFSNFSDGHKQAKYPIVSRLAFSQPRLWWCVLSRIIRNLSNLVYPWDH